MTKGINPKEKYGEAKYQMSVVPTQTLALMSVAMEEGTIKYGNHNYRETAVKASTYYNANMRHWQAWYEGRDIDPDSGLPELVKAAACSIIMIDAIMNDNWEDDRPPPPKGKWQDYVNDLLQQMRDKV